LDYIGLDGLGQRRKPAATLSHKRTLDAAAPERRAEEKTMNLLVHASILALGCATFFGIILYSNCPACGWHEWVGDLFDKDKAP
jgi:hypothetical protein